jgi:nickel/cobalt exporter
MNFSDVLAQGTHHAWLYFPTAIVLGALHGLEPGHAKTMMAAFIVAVRGTVKQAILLGLSATLSHTAIVWIVAIGGMVLGRSVDASRLEPYFQLASALCVIGIALWMLWRTWRDEWMWKRRRSGHGSHVHAHGHTDASSHNCPHTHDRGAQETVTGLGVDSARIVDTGHGRVALTLFGEGMPQRWRLRTIDGQAWRARSVSITTIRPDGRKQRFGFYDKPGYLESIEPVPQPHLFHARLILGHTGHSHDYDLPFGEVTTGQAASGPQAATETVSEVYQDAHERAHARDIETRFADRDVGTGQIVLFGLTGGLVPCPAAITVLLLCLQLKQVALGAVLVLCFSIGLAVTLVAVGVAAAVSVRKANARWPWLSTVARRAPYFSSTLMLLVGLYIAYQGWVGLPIGP